ncbi:MAG: hypothetical protein N3E52_01405 [Candidatus Bathyarchaeota archaeon]|nr:hypothetical protein [Candidatus Bathyarchaeota archaeon]
MLQATENSQRLQQESVKIVSDDAGVKAALSTLAYLIRQLPCLPFNTGMTIGVNCL